jgi:hypothetical protein
MQAEARSTAQQRKRPIRGFVPTMLSGFQKTVKTFHAVFLPTYVGRSTPDRAVERPT